MQSQALALAPNIEVHPFVACVSKKESCVDPSGQNPKMGDSNKCRLYVDDSPSQLVALGRVYEGRQQSTMFL